MSIFFMTFCSVEVGTPLRLRFASFEVVDGADEVTEREEEREVMVAARGRGGESGPDCTLLLIDLRAVGKGTEEVILDFAVETFD